jgi:hypothetical protein
VGAEPEREVVVGGAADVERLGVVEPRFVEVGRFVEQDHLIPLVE